MESKGYHPLLTHFCIFTSTIHPTSDSKMYVCVYFYLITAANEKTHYACISELMDPRFLDETSDVGGRDSTVHLSRRINSTRNPSAS